MKRDAASLDLVHRYIHINALCSLTRALIIVSEKELETYLSNGWEFVSGLPSRRKFIRK